MTDFIREKANKKNKNVTLYVHSEKHNAQALRAIIWEKCREAQIKPEILTSPILDKETGDFLEVVTIEITSEDGKSDKAKEIAKETIGI